MLAQLQPYAVLDTMSNGEAAVQCEQLCTEIFVPVPGELSKLRQMQESPALSACERIISGKESAERK